MAPSPRVPFPVVSEADRLKTTPARNVILQKKQKRSNVLGNARRRIAELV